MKFVRTIYSQQKGERLYEDIEMREKRKQIIKDRMNLKISKQEFESLQKEMRKYPKKRKLLYYESELPEGSEIIKE